MRRIVNLCEQTKIPYRTLPSLHDITTGKTSITHIRKVTVEDLLCRDQIQFDNEKIVNCINNKKILITGAGGSIGSELCRKISNMTPAAMILIELSEFNLFKIHNEISAHFPHLILHCYLVSITDSDMINQIMSEHKPDYVFHAAAYKHVPLLEPQVRQAIENNIFGTQIVAEAAKKNHIKKFILISTDKVVNPNNVMGATKRCAELLCQSLNQKSHTRFITIRFGNVLGSTGSVIPTFEEQIAKGGPVTVTHPEMERFFMTIAEAAQLIIQTIAIDSGSDLYVLDMGEPVRIQYLAEQMIKFSGHVPNVDIKIVYTGLRPGEKLTEELFFPDEKIQKLAEGKIFHVEAQPINFVSFMQHLQQLKQACQVNHEDLKKQLFFLAKAHFDTLSESVNYSIPKPLKREAHDSAVIH
jgi:FlaA1/EpsC-like NDP-sugar epimerase